MFLTAWTDSELVAGILFDTSVYVRALRQGDPSILTVRRARRARDGGSYPLWFSAVGGSVTARRSKGHNLTRRWCNHRLSAPRPSWACPLFSPRSQAPAWDRSF